MTLGHITAGEYLSDGDGHIPLHRVGTAERLETDDIRARLALADAW